MSTATQTATSSTADLVVRDIPLNLIAPSPTNPRKSFPDDYINELAGSIAGPHGQIQAGMVRWQTARAEDVVAARNAGLHPAFGPGDEFYQIVIGECRVRGCALANRPTFRAEVRDLSDDDVEIIQNIENLQRKDLDPIEEAEGFRKLMDKGLRLEEIAVKIGKSIQHVSAVAKLTDLIEVGKRLLRNGWLSAGHGILIARIDPDMDQPRAIAAVFGTHLDNVAKIEEQDIFDLAKEAIDLDSPLLSEKGLRQWIKDNVNLDLTKASWKLDDATLHPEAGPCSTCQFRSGNNPALFGELADGKNICMRPVCYQEKKRRQLAQVQRHGEYVRLSVAKAYEPPKEGATLLKANQWVPAKKGECNYVIEGYFIDGDQAGTVVSVCWDHKCKKHPHDALNDTGDEKRASASTSFNTDELEDDDSTATASAPVVLHGQDATEIKVTQSSPAPGPASQRAIDNTRAADERRKAEAKAEREVRFAIAQNIIEHTEYLHPRLVITLAKQLYKNQIGNPAFQLLNPAKNVQSKLSQLTHDDPLLAKIVITSLLSCNVDPMYDAANGREDFEALITSLGGNPTEARKLVMKQHSAKAESSPAPKVTSIEGLNKQLHRALHHFEGAEARWAALRKKGASDDELREALGYDLGLGGSSSSRDIGSVAYKGGKNPGIWFNSISTQGKPSLQGKELLAAVRDLLGIRREPAKEESSPRRHGGAEKSKRPDKGNVKKPVKPKAKAQKPATKKAARKK